ncbi:MAG: hypothetical protein M3137_17235 [Actinomycetota bacterium]|nr:hypothetical protein [Actinomycetota bacterium]
MRRRWPLVLAVFAVVAVAAVYAEPIQDGDLFWHLAYARQILHRHTLIPDPSLYSWTPASNRTIYCAWIGELFLLGIFNVAGLTGLFVLRYVVVAAVAALLWWFARRVGRGSSPVTVLVIVVVVLAAKAGTIIKPELLSFLLFTLVVGSYFQARWVTQHGGDGRRWLVAVPVIVLVWVNTHGAFILVVVFLVATALGEVANARFSRRAALPRRELAWLLGCWAACAVAVNLTPYGPRYPLQLVGDYVLGDLARPDAAWNAAYRSIYAHSALGLHLIDYGVVMAVVLASVLVYRVVRGSGAINFAAVAAVVAYLPLFVLQLRATYLLAVVFGFAVMELLATPDLPGEVRRSAPKALRARPVAASVATAAVIVLGARAGYGAYAAPTAGSWLGFGTGYVNPVVETAYLQRLQRDRPELGPRLYNIFDSGGYLLWRLYPHDRVMIDSRSFPYLSWFSEQFAFATGSDVAGFVARHPANVAVIDLLKANTWEEFLRLDGWHLAFYGPTAAVFVRDAHGGLLDNADPLWQWRSGLRNASTTLNVFEFATYFGDYPTAWRELDRLRGPLSHQLGDSGRRGAANDYQLGYQALNAGNYTDASTLLRRGLTGRPVSAHDARVVDLLDRLVQARATGDQAGVTALARSVADLAYPAARHAPTGAG